MDRENGYTNNARKEGQEDYTPQRLYPALSMITAAAAVVNEWMTRFRFFLRFGEQDCNTTGHGWMGWGRLSTMCVWMSRFGVSKVMKQKPKNNTSRINHLE